VDRGEGRRQTRRIRRSKFDEAKLQRFGQQAGSHDIVPLDLIEPFATNGFFYLFKVKQFSTFYLYEESLFLLVLLSSIKENLNHS